MAASPASGPSPSDLALEVDPLALDPAWPSPTALVPLEEALEQSVFRSGLSRQEWLQRLARSLHKPALLPLLWLLPRGWRLAPAELPPRLQALAGVVERGLLTPTLLAALADDLPHLLPPPETSAPTALELWSAEEDPQLPCTLAALLALEMPEPEAPASAPLLPQRRDPPQGLSGGLVWANEGLHHGQSPQERQRNSRCARALNRLGANLSGSGPWVVEGCSTAADLVQRLEGQGWQVWAQLRSAVTSFGLGASLPLESGEGWAQVPLALPIRTGLLDRAGREHLSLLPHCCLEMEWRREDDIIRLQYYQGIEGLCGWEGLNDLHRPWQNDPRNGTIRYFGEVYRGNRLLNALAFCDGMALVHNLEATDRRLLHGGYGPLGLCIDSAALLQQGLEGSCDVFPVLLGGIWRERLERRCRRVMATAPLHRPQREALEAYRCALQALPYDGFPYGLSAHQAAERLRACQPLSSPFRLVAALAQDPASGGNS